jgi:hypothetical protein
MTDDLVATHGEGGHQPRRGFLIEGRMNGIKELDSQGSGGEEGRTEAHVGKKVPMSSVAFTSIPFLWNTFVGRYSISNDTD